MGNDLRAVWKGLGIVLALASVALVAVAVSAFTRVPDAPPGETRDLALGLMCMLLVLVFAVLSWACLATGRGNTPSADVRDDAGDRHDDRSS